MQKNIKNASLLISRPRWDHSRLESRIVHLGCGAFHRAHQALFVHHLLEISDTKWGICEVNLISGKGKALIENLRKQNFFYTIAEKGIHSTKLKIIGAIKEALHPELDGCCAVLKAMVRPKTAIVSLTITEKGYCIEPSTGRLDINNTLIEHDIRFPKNPKSAIGYIVEALRIRREKKLAPFTVLSCDNLCKNGDIARTVILDLAREQDVTLSEWISKFVTFPCTMVDRIVPATTQESLEEIANLLGVYDPCAIVCEPFIQWVIEDKFVNNLRPEWDKVGVQFVDDVVPFETMKLRMLNGSHSFLAYLGSLSGYETISDTMSHLTYRKATHAFMIKEQVPTLSVLKSIDLNLYANTIIERFSNPSLQHKTLQVAMDGSQKLPYRMLDSIRYHIKNGSEFKRLTLGIASWMRYLLGIDEKGNTFEVIDPLSDIFLTINQRHPSGDDRIKALLNIHSIFDTDLIKNQYFVKEITRCYQNLCQVGVYAVIKELS